jgi:hypothetical protein
MWWFFMADDKQLMEIRIKVKDFRSKVEAAKNELARLERLGLTAQALGLRKQVNDLESFLQRVEAEYGRLA